LRRIQGKNQNDFSCSRLSSIHLLFTTLFPKHINEINGQQSAKYSNGFSIYRYVLNIAHRSAFIALYGIYTDGNIFLVRGALPGRWELA